MPALTVTLDELKLAWQRFKLDRLDRSFVDHPHIVEWVELDEDQWLGSIQNELALGFKPTSSRLCLAAKTADLLRPGVILNVRDEVVYNLLVGRLYGDIVGSLLSIREDPDFGCRPARDARSQKWLASRFNGWQTFRDRSLGMLKRSAFLVETDIAGFFENIDLPLLMSDLRGACGNRYEIDLLYECLRRWAMPRARGIPQGHSASQILAKLFLTPIDRALQNNDIAHVRFVDDIRIFCKSHSDGRRALDAVIRLLYRRGLSVQSAKTKVISEGEARSRIDNVMPAIERVHGEVKRELESEFAEGGPYSVAPRMTTQRMLDLLSESQGPPIAVLERTFEDAFVIGHAPFNSSLFHYVLKRLGAARSRVALQSCLQFLRSRPEETDHIVSYLEHIGASSGEIVGVVEYMGSEDAVNDHQLYQLMGMCCRRRECDEGVLGLARKWSADSKRLYWLRTMSTIYVGKWGDQSDLEALQERYGLTSDELERAELVMALRRLEKSRRNAFYSQAQGDGELVRRAVQVARREA